MHFKFSSGRTAALSVLIPRLWFAPVPGQQWNLSDSLGSILGLNSLQDGGAQRPVTINLLYLKQR